MQEIWITLITVLGGIVTTLVGFLIKSAKDKRKLKKRNEALKELCNYGYGQIDMIIQNSIKVEPEVRDAMRKASRRYHRLDLIKDKPDNEISKEDK